MWDSQDDETHALRPTPLDEALKDLVEASSKRPDPRAPSLPRPTGIAELDAVTGGLNSGELWTILGPDDSGKTSLALELATRIASRSTEERCAWFSCRDAASRVAAQLLSRASGLQLVPGDTFSDDASIERLQGAAGALRQVPIDLYGAHDSELSFPVIARLLAETGQGQTSLVVFDDPTKVSRFLRGIRMGLTGRTELGGAPLLLRQMRNVGTAVWAPVLATLPTSSAEVAEMVADVTLTITSETESGEEIVVDVRVPRASEDAPTTRVRIAPTADAIDGSPR